MKIAVPFRSGQVLEQFGNAERFKLCEVTDGVVTMEFMADTDGKKHGALAGFLKDNGVDVLICDGVGPMAKAALEETDIRLCTGVSGKVHEVVRAFLAGELVWAPETKCIDYDESEEEPDESRNWRRGCH